MNMIGESLPQDEQIGLPRPLRHYGNTLPLGTKPNGEPRFMLGPHYYVFFSAFLVSIGITYYLLRQMTKNMMIGWTITLYVSSALFLLSYLKIGFSIPGLVTPSAEQQQGSQRYCKPCRALRQPYTVHCLDCDICIRGHDHHCPWIGKCVGADNLSDFYFFLVMTFGNLIMMLVATVFGQNLE